MITQLVRLYALTLRLYPRSFYDRYAAEMLEAARLDLAASRHPLRTFTVLAWDAVTSAFRESVRIPQPMTARPVILTAVLISVWLFGICMVNQQKLRRGADHQPERITAQLASQLSNGNQPQAVFNTSGPEITSTTWLQSTSTFAALYDNSGNVLAANATLHGSLPQPPHGIFSTIRQRGLYKVTWQPQPGVRVALVGRALPNGTFLVAGQSLLPGEASYARFAHAMQSLWLVLSVFLLFLLAMVLAGTRSQTSTRS